MLSIGYPRFSTTLTDVTEPTGYKVLQVIACYYGPVLAPHGSKQAKGCNEKLDT